MGLLHGHVRPLTHCIHGQSPSANVIDPRNGGREHSQSAFKVTHLAAGGSFFISLAFTP